MSYRLEGRILEVCDCRVLCPCWIGEDPDNGTCDSVVAYHIDQGEVEGVGVSGLTMAEILHIPGNVLDGNFQAVLVLDDHATEEQERLLLQAWRGELGGVLSEMSKLIGEVKAVERASIEFTVQEGKGRLRIGESVSADIAPYTGPTGQVTTLNDSIYSTIAGSPAYVAKADHWRAVHPLVGWDIDLKGHNAIQGQFLFEG